MLSRHFAAGLFLEQAERTTGHDNAVDPASPNRAASDSASRWQNAACLTRIADALTVRGVPIKTGKSAAWTHQAVLRILKREHGAAMPLQGQAASANESTAAGLLTGPGPLGVQ